MMRHASLIFLGSLLMMVAAAISAHEVRPGLLQLTETAPDQFDMLWRVPARGELTLALEPVLPAACQRYGVPERVQDGSRLEERQSLRCDGGLSGKLVTIGGLDRLKTDVLVSVRYQTGGNETQRATPEAPAVTLKGQRSTLQVATTYLGLGVEHILLGIDHLLFVAALMLLVQGRKRLLVTVTTFTLAHSITLVLATLGVVAAPSTLIESLIALSIVVVAAEVVLLQKGETGIAIRHPWLIAFGFGLLHGFGFAGALSELGLPPEAVPTALLFFNLGVEAGQLLFIAVLLLGFAAVRDRMAGYGTGLRRGLPLGMGVVAAFWAVERTVAIWA